MAISAQTHSGEKRTRLRPSRGPRKAAVNRRVTPRRAASSRKAAPVSFKSRSTLDDAIAAVVKSCRDHWQANLPAALTGGKPEGVHQVRVGLRRFRSALSLFRKFIPENQREWLNAEAKWLANQLGPVRDLDVFLSDLTARFEGAKGAENTAALAAVARVVSGRPELFRRIANLTR